MNLRALSLVAFALAVLIWAASLDATPRLSWLSRVPVARSEGESKEARTERLSRIESAITRAARGDRELIAAMVVVGTFESHWSRDIQAGRCGKHQCDRDPKTGKPRALGVYQLWRPACAKLHDLPKPDIDVSSVCAANLLRFGRKRCGHWRGAFASFAGSLDCDHPIGMKREAMRLRLLGRGGAS